MTTKTTLRNIDIHKDGNKIIAAFEEVYGEKETANQLLQRFFFRAHRSVFTRCHSTLARSALTRVSLARFTSATSILTRFQFGAYLFGSLPLRRVSLWRTSTSARIYLARFHFGAFLFGALPLRRVSLWRVSQFCI